VPKHSRGWTSIARSLEEGESRPIDDQDENIEITLGIRIKDRDPRITAMALNSANLAVFALMLFMDRVLMNKAHSSWLIEFKSHYLRELKDAKAAQ
jgi:hypothetical protein